MDIYRPDKGSRIVKIAIIAVIALAAITGIVFGIRALGGTDLDKAIGEYEDGDYVDALRKLNALARRTGYEKGEMIYYYRCKAVNRLAEKLERRFDDELRLLASPDTEKDRREREQKELEEDLRDLNGDIQGDLKLVKGGGTARIMPGGRFYDEFISRYKGSRYIEDLDFEEIEKVERADRGALLNAISNFYAKYPRTSYLSQIVRILFNNIEKSAADLAGRTDMLMKLISDYGRRYPTSSEMQRIFTCKGNDVNLRNTPGVQGKVVGKVKKDDILIQIEKSMDTVQIGEVRDYWYRIADLRGLQGWIFGKFLAPIDVARFGGVEQEETWSMDENFAEWSDSNTPKNWIHIDGGDPSSMSFFERGGKRYAKIACAQDKTAGLYRRVQGTRAFAVQARARFVAGDAVTLFAYSLGGQGVFFLKIARDEMDVSGRRIPIGTLDWHDYRLSSSDGRYASVYVDGELISSRIPPVQAPEQSKAGLYCLVSAKGQSSTAEMEYIRIR